MKRVLWFLCSLAFSFGAAAPARALESEPVVTPHARVTLASDVDSVDPAKSFQLGLHFKLTKGWHIYWVNPGAAGEPPELDLSLPQGAKASAIAWPVPIRLKEGLVMTYSYLGEVLLPVVVTSSQRHPSFHVTAKAHWLVCANICVPEQGTFHLDLPIGKATPSAVAPLFAAAAARAPQPSPFDARVLPNATLSVHGNGLSPQSVHDAWFLPTTWGEIDDLAPQKISVGDGELKLALKPGETFNPRAPISGVLVIEGPNGGERFLTIDARSELGPLTSVATGARPAAAQQTSAPVTRLVGPGGAISGKPIANAAGLAWILGFAFLGGLILNLMPCVFPILAMKALTFAKVSRQTHGVVRAHAASYVFGVLAAFAAIAGLLLALRAGGTTVGWGFQFQSPVFVTIMVWLLLAIGFNLSGVFEVGGRFVEAGDGLTRLHGRAGSFFTGLLAVLVATPCTAPFMGVAIAATVTASPAFVFLIFLAMGLGLAAPYALLALIPAASALLPKPGLWMLILKQVLAFPMYGAAVWLVWVLSLQAGAQGVLLALSGAVLVAFAAWLLGATQGRESRANLFGKTLAAVAVICALVLLRGVSVAPPDAAATVASSTDSLPYSEGRLAALRAEGRPVFVDMTAAWCVTCLVNERVALASVAVRRAFTTHNVAYIKGDWTRADPAITRFLQAHGRDGVPLYVYFPVKGQPVVLPQILTADIVLDELNRTHS